MMLENFLISLQIMGKGMGGIFAALIIIMLCVKVLAAVTGKKKEEK